MEPHEASWDILESPGASGGPHGASWNLLELPEGSLSLLEAAGTSWKTLEPSGSCSTPLEAPVALERL